MSEAEATTVLEGLKSLTAEEPPALDVQAIADAATRKVVEALSAAPESESSRLQSEADPAEVVSEKPTVSAPETPVAVLLPASPILLDAEVVSLLRASLKAGLTDVTCHVLSVMLKD